jgi:hypothetical protein
VNGRLCPTLSTVDRGRAVGTRVIEVRKQPEELVETLVRRDHELEVLLETATPRCPFDVTRVTASTPAVRASRPGARYAGR